MNFLFIFIFLISMANQRKLDERIHELEENSENLNKDESLGSI